MNQLAQKVESFRDLQYNWNGYGAKPLTKKVIENALVFCRILSERCQVFPTANNSIQFEWKEKCHTLEIEVFEDRVENNFIDLI